MAHVLTGASKLSERLLNSACRVIRHSSPPLWNEHAKHKHALALWAGILLKQRGNPADDLPGVVDGTLAGVEDRFSKEIEKLFFGEGLAPIADVKVRIARLETIGKGSLVCRLDSGIA